MCDYNNKRSQRNVSSKEESPIEGTIGVFVRYAQIIDFLEKAGGFVGFRSGFCDIVSGAKTKKAVLYPKESDYMNSTFYDYFSLKPTTENYVFLVLLY